MARFPGPLAPRAEGTRFGGPNPLTQLETPFLDSIVAGRPLLSDLPPPAAAPLHKELGPLGTEIVGRTAEGRNEYLNPDGRVSSERSVTVPMGHGWTNIPSVFGGREFHPDQAAEIMRRNGWVDPETGRAAEMFPDIETAVASAERRSAGLGAEIAQQGSFDFRPPSNFQTGTPPVEGPGAGSPAAPRNAFLDVIPRVDRPDDLAAAPEPVPAEAPTTYEGRPPFAGREIPGTRYGTEQDRFAADPFFQQGWFKRNIGDRLETGGLGLATTRDVLSLQGAIEEAKSLGRLTTGVPGPAAMVGNDPDFVQQRTVELVQESMDALAGIARYQKMLQAIPQDPRLAEASQDPSWQAFWRLYGEDPVGITARAIVESTPLMLPGMALGVATGGAGAGALAAGTAMGVNSFLVEDALTFLDLLAQRGVDTTDPEALRAAMADRALVEDATLQAGQKAGVVGLFDAFSAGIASKTLIPLARQAQLGKLGTEAANLGIQLPIQVAAGGGGEALSQLATTGEINPVDVGLEMVAELNPADVLALRHAEPGTTAPAPAGEAPVGGPAPEAAPGAPAPEAPPAPSGGPLGPSVPPAAVLQGEIARVLAGEKAADVVSPAPQPAPSQPQQAPVPTAAELASFGLPETGQDVTVDFGGGEVVNGRLESATEILRDNSEAIMAVRVVAPDGQVYEFESDTATVRPRGDGSPKAPVVAQTAADVAAAAERVEQPTPAQAEAGNYRMGHLKIHGLEVAIETPQGGTRTATDGSWSVENYPAHYGYLKAGEGADGDKVDTFIGPNPEARQVFVIDQIDPATGKFDEHKVMLGFARPVDAANAYLAAFSDGSGDARVGAITPMNIDRLRAWLRNGDTTKALSYQPPAAAPAPASPPVPERVGEPPEEGARRRPTPGVAPAAEVVTGRDSPLQATNRVTTAGKAMDSFYDTFWKWRKLGEALRKEELTPAQAETTRKRRTHLTTVIEDWREHLVRWLETQPEGDNFAEGVANLLDSVDREMRREAEAALRKTIAEKESVPPPAAGEHGPAATADEPRRGSVLSSPAEQSTAEPSPEFQVGTRVIFRTPDGEREHGTVRKRTVLTLAPLLGGAATQMVTFEVRLDNATLEITNPSTLELEGDQKPEQPEIEAAGGQFKPRQIIDRMKYMLAEAARLRTSAGKRGTMQGTRDGMLENADRREREGRELGAGYRAWAAKNPERAQRLAASIPADVVAAFIDAPTPPEPPSGETAKPSSETSEPSSPGAAPLTIERFSDKASIIRGETKANMARIKSIPGIRPFWHGKGKGWIVPTAKLDAVRKHLGDLLGGADQKPAAPAPVVQPASKPAETAAPKVGEKPQPKFKRGDVVLVNRGDDGQTFDVARVTAVITKGDIIPTREGYQPSTPRFEYHLELEDGSHSSAGEAMLQRAQATTRFRPFAPPQATPETPAPAPSDQGEKINVGSAPTSGYGKKNKVFTEDAAEKARRILRQKLGQLSAGIDPEIVQAGTVLAGYHFEAGARSFAAFSAAMVKDIGEAIRPFLRSLYEGLRYYPELDTAGMTPAAEIEEAGNAPDVPQADSRPAPGEPSEAVSGIATGEPPASTPGRGSGAGGEPARDDAAPVSRPEPGSGGSEPRDEGEGAGPRGPVRDGDRVRPGSEPAGPGDAASDGAGRLLTGKNYVITDDAIVGQSGEARRTRNNLEAIRTLKKVLGESRTATRDEQDILVRYVGWGALKSVFDENNRNTINVREELKKLLTDDEYRAARGSVLNAHYSSTAVVRAMWDMLDRLGFKGGKILEPSVGTGNFIGMMGPARGRSTWRAVELDTITGQIARLLYPKAQVDISGFERVKLPKDYYDLAISNVPFGEYGVHDPAYNDLNIFIHDYFFLRSLDLVRPGGVVAFISSSGTMDKPGTKVRGLIADRADLVAAFRLPGGSKGAFAKNAGTEVTTDILILRKRAPGEKPSGPAFRETKEIASPEGPIPVNEYYAARPDHMLGTMRKTGTMYRADMAQLEPHEGQTIEEALEAAKKLLPEALDWTRTAPTAEQPKSADVQVPETAKEGSLFLAGNRIHRLQNGAPVQLERSEGVTGKRIRGFIALRDGLRELLRAEAGNAPEAAQAKLRKALNKAYDAFVKEFGPVNWQTRQERTAKDGSPRVSFLYQNLKGAIREDPEWPVVAALEIYDQETATAEKAPILSRRMVGLGAARPETVNSVQEAIPIVLREHGRLDEDAIVGLMGGNRERTLSELPLYAFKNPASQTWETEDEYLSGNVRVKLVEAREAAKKNAGFTRNVEALEAVQPQDLVPSALADANGDSLSDIYARLGATWIEPEIVEAFITELLGVPDGAVEVSYNRAGDIWRVASKHREARHGVRAVVESGTSRAPALSLLEAALQGKRPVIRDRQDDGTSVVNADETKAANLKYDAMMRRFSVWVWEDEERSKNLAEIYNWKLNNTVRRVFNGEHLTFPGMADTVRNSRGEMVPFELRPHQKAAVWRILSRGNTLLNHEVGAGKTYVMVAAAMEGRRLGLVRRPMIVVPNHMLMQFSREFLQAYPAAKILVAEQRQFDREKRKGLLARMATGDHDAIIITHSAFSRIPMSGARIQAFLQSQMDELEQAIEHQVQADNGKKSPTVRELEKVRKNLAKRIETLLNAEGKDAGLTFEETGVDQVMVDEAHLFKNLQLITRMSRVKGMPTAASSRATDLFMKTQYLEDTNPGRGTVFATATPISNTLGELYVMQRYLQFAVLRENGHEHFDAWAKTFATTSMSTEMKPGGKGLRVAERFNKFLNVPELAVIFGEVSDLQTADMLNLPRPKLATGAPQLMIADPSPAQLAKVDELSRRAEQVKGRPAKGGDNMLRIVSEGRKAATDMRLLDDARYGDDAGSKINMAVGKLFDGWEAGKAEKLTQLVFLDMGVPGRKRSKAAEVEDDAEEDGSSYIIDDTPEDTEEGEAPAEEKAADNDAASADTGFNLYDDMKRKLVARGVPEAEIAFIHNAKTDQQKGDLFSKMRAGKVRILIGSTEKMGVGMNVQDRLKSLHHLDAPWRPSDMRQRDGRGLRQGNMNAEIDIFRYITRKTFDGYMWQTLEAKDRMITQFFAGTAGKRTIEDIDLALPEASTIKAIIADNPLMFEMAALEKEVENLTIEHRQFVRTAGNIRFEIQSRPQRILGLKEKLGRVEGELEALPSIKGEKFALKIGKRDFTVRKEAAEALRAILTPRLQGLVPGETERIKVGEAGPFSLYVSARPDVWRDMKGGEERIYDLTAVVQGQATYEGSRNPIRIEELANTGMIQRFENLLEGRGQVRDRIKAEIAGEESELENLRKQPTIFPRQAELQLKKARLEWIVVALEADQTGKERPPEPSLPPLPIEPPKMSQTAPGGVPRYFVNAPGTVEQRRQVEATMKAELAKLGLADRVGAQVVDAMLDVDRLRITDAKAMYWRNIITLLADTADVATTTRHEAVHAMRRLGLINDAEWAVLTEAAKKVWISQYKIRTRYAGLTEDEIVEEAIADAIAEFRADKLKTGGRLLRALNRIKAVLEAVRNAFAGAGFRSTERIVADIAGGQAATRSPTRRPKHYGAIGADEWASEVHDLLGPDADPTATLAASRADMDAMFSLVNEPDAESPSVDREASEPGRLVILGKKDGKDVNPLKRWLYTPSRAVAAYPELASLVAFGIQTETDMSRWVKRFRSDYSALRNELSKAQFAELSDVLFLGDAEAVEFTDEQLAGMGVEDRQVRAAYARMRTLIEKVGRFVDKHRRSMMPALRARKAVLLGQMARIRVMDDVEFRRLYGRRSRLRQQLRTGGAGKNPVTLAAEIDRIEAQLNIIREGTDEYSRLAGEVDQIDGALAKTSIRRRTGYIPHKFFGSWGVYEQVDTGEKDEKGRPRIERRLVAGERGFFEDQAAAVAAAKAFLEANPSAKLVVQPIEFNFPASTATGLSDASYWKFLGNVSDALALEGDELHEAIKGVARRRFRRRIAGFAQQRKGVKGYARDLDAVMSAHIGEAVRYVTLDKLKFRAINTMERMGLSRYRSANQAQKTLQDLMDAWLRDVNGEKQPSEIWIDQILDSEWAKPSMVAATAGVLLGTGFAMAGSPVLGTALGAYVAWRTYGALKRGGPFKLRAVQSAFTSDVAHMKLGAFLNVYSALANLSQTMLNTYPVLGLKYTALGTKMAAKAWASKKIGRPNRHAKLLERAEIMSLFRFAETGPGVFDEEGRIRRASMFFFNSAEAINQASAFLGGYQRAIDRGLSEGQAFRQAQTAVRQRTQHHYGMANKPEILRAHWAKVAVQFKNFMFQQIAFVAGLRGVELPRFLLSMLLVSGALGLPIWWLEPLVSALFSFSPLLWIKEKVLELQARGDLWGSAANILARGLPSIFGEDLSGRVGMGDKFGPQRLEDLQGPAIGTLRQLADLAELNAGITDYLQTAVPGLGRPLKMLEAQANGLPFYDAALRPDAFWRALTDDEIRLTSGWKKQATEANESLLDSTDLAFMSLGSTRLEMSQARDLREIAAHETAALQRKRGQVMAAITAAATRFADDPARREEALHSILIRARDDGVMITNPQVQQRIKEAFTPRLQRLVADSQRQIRRKIADLAAGIEGGEPE